MWASSHLGTTQKRKRHQASRRRLLLDQIVSMFLFNLILRDIELKQCICIVVEDTSAKSQYAMPEISVPASSRSKAQPDPASASTSKEKKADSSVDIKRIREQHAEEQASGRYVCRSCPARITNH